jgi:excisionase family DNA binding protein
MPRLVNPKPPRVPLPRRVYSIDEFAEMTGLCRATIYGMMRRGEMPFIVVGGRRRIPAAAVDKLLATAE